MAGYCHEGGGIDEGAQPTSRRGLLLVALLGADKRGRVLHP